MRTRMLFNIILVMLMIKSKGMNSDTAQYRIVSTKECIEYIEKFGLTIHDDSEYRIKSNSGLVYILPNTEVVLLPTNFDLNYPGMIFKDLKIFKYYAELNFFPIGEGNMTWFERFNNQIKNFRKDPQFYRKVLSEKLNVTVPFKNIGDIALAFTKVQSFIGAIKRIDFSFEQTCVICSFGLAVIDYLIDNKGYNLILKDGYENYNPTTSVLIEKKGEIKDIITTCLIFLDGNIPNALDSFMRALDIQQERL